MQATREQFPVGKSLFLLALVIRYRGQGQNICYHFLFCYERDFMKSLSRENQADIIEAFNLTSKYLDDLLNIDNI